MKLLSSPSTTNPAPISQWTAWLKHRWPTALGVAIAGLAALDIDGGAEFGSLVIVMALVYLGAAVLERRTSAWPLLLGGLVVFGGIRLLDIALDPSGPLLVIALAFLVAGLARRLWRRSHELSLQSAAMLLFGGTVLLALYVSPDVGSYLVAAALLGHGVWDAIHFLRDRVVVRSYAEFCSVVDLLLGLAIIFTR